jgi:hypothetical protein
MSQTAYSAAMTAGYAGEKFDVGEMDVVSMISEESSAQMPFGVVVARGTADAGCKLPALDTDVPAGIVAHSHAYERNGELGTTGVQPKMAVNVMRRGRIWVTAEEAVAPGDRLFVRIVAGSGGSQLGACRKSAVAGETIDCSAQGEFQTTATTGALALIDVNFVAK